MSIALVAVVAMSTRQMESVWVSLVLSVGFGHYVLSVIYAKQPIRRVFSHPQWVVALTLFGIGFYALYSRQFSLLLLFGIHHVFYEVYLPDRVLRLSDARLAMAFRFARTGLNFFIFFVILRNAPVLQSWNRPLLYFGLGASTAIVVLLMSTLRRSVGRGCSWIFARSKSSGCSWWHCRFQVDLQLLHVVLYHLIFWALYPLPKMLEHGAPSALTSVGLNLVLTAGFFLLSPSSPLGSIFTNPQWFGQFRLWSYFHIGTAFALSTAFPAWITRWFASSRALATAR